MSRLVAIDILPAESLISFADVSERSITVSGALVTRA
jgi:hypothetical protein